MRRFIVGAFRGRKRRKAQAELRASIYWGVLACYIKEASLYTTTYATTIEVGILIVTKRFQ
jgi:hypothetical protein